MMEVYTILPYFCGQGLYSDNRLENKGDESMDASGSWCSHFMNRRR